MKKGMKKVISLTCLIFIICFVLLFNACEKKSPSLPIGLSGEEIPWPSPFPCRIEDKGNPDLFLLGLGKVTTPLAEAIFDPIKDKVTLADGQIIENYFRDRLKIKYYTPIDKKFFPLPPSGWCSWYYYYREINEKEIEKNARWLAENLKDFGAVYCQIDDGWQGRGSEKGNYRDWSTIDPKFSSGMANLALKIKKLGLKPGIWLAPHGQSNPEIVRQSQAFLVDEKGESLSRTWEGDYLLDPTRPEALNYLADLFRKLSQEWGYEYFKIDGQPIVIREYRTKLSLMKNPGAEAEELYRQTLKVIRETIGPQKYLLGCWGVPLEGMGYMNGSRTGGDVVIPWEGFLMALQATMRFYFLHNIAWYCDPDVMLVRYPLTLNMARAWATLQGLTGQALMASDRLYDLPPERVEIMKRVYPAVDIRPIDLFPAEQNKRLWDLKIHHLGRSYDVVGCFNFDERQSNGLELKWADLGLPPDSLVHVYDFWNQEYLGCWEKGIYVSLEPASVRVFCLHIAKNEPQLISTSRHITQGWVDLVSLKSDPTKRIIEGKSRVIANDPYELRFSWPRTEKIQIIRAKVSGSKARIKNYHNWAVVSFVPQKTGQINWQVEFGQSDVYSFPPRQPSRLQAQPAGLDALRLTWSPLYYLCAGYLISINDKPVLYSPLPEAIISGLNPQEEQNVKVQSIWWDGTTSPEAALIKVNLGNLLPTEVFLDTLRPKKMTSGWGRVRINRAVSGAELKISNRSYPRGLGTHAPSEIILPIYKLFRWLEGEVGVDGASPRQRGSVEFIIYGDGRMLWRSGLMKAGQPSKSFRIAINQIQELYFEVTDGGDGSEGDHADWVMVRLIK
ncbi:MAG: NPCBM/NEW2 domain-containing protein [Candidatus Aminicenantes bacterium]|nr:NPCBM/NEW2 domain-containing protein [Candidatus Aminicenantes bacterium]